jgi:hypothetical protein
MEEDTESKGKRIRKRGHLEDSGRAKKKKSSNAETGLAEKIAAKILHLYLKNEIYMDYDLDCTYPGYLRKAYVSYYIYRRVVERWIQIVFTLS